MGIDKFLKVQNEENKNKYEEFLWGCEHGVVFVNNTGEYVKSLEWLDNNINNKIKIYDYVDCEKANLILGNGEMIQIKML